MTFGIGEYPAAYKPNVHGPYNPSINYAADVGRYDFENVIDLMPCNFKQKEHVYHQGHRSL